MTEVTVRPRTAPSPADYGQMLEELLVELEVHKHLAHRIANHVTYGAPDLYVVVDRVLAIGLDSTQWSTLRDFAAEMATDVESWRPNSANYTLYPADAQRMHEIHPALDGAYWRLNQLIEAVDLAAYNNNR